MDQQRSAFTSGEDPGQGLSQGSGQGLGREPGRGPEARRKEPRRRAAESEALRQEAAALYRAQLHVPLVPAGLTQAFSVLPRARLTALGSGLLGVVVMVLTGAAAAWLFDGSPALFGAGFLLAALACSAWVRPANLFAAPVTMPLAFVAGLCFLSGGTGDRSLAERATSLFTALAVNAMWLYAGTLLAACVATVRKVALTVQRSRVRALMEARDAEDEDADLRR